MHLATAVVRYYLPWWELQWGYVLLSSIVLISGLPGSSRVIVRVAYACSSPSSRWRPFSAFLFCGVWPILSLWELMRTVAIYKTKRLRFSQGCSGSVQQYEYHHAAGVSCSCFCCGSDTPITLATRAVSCGRRSDDHFCSRFSLLKSQRD